jgi:nucleotide-binding universal stress UspA family protein
MATSRATTPTTPAQSAPAATDPAPFSRIACGVDGSRSAFEGVRQAAALAGSNTTIEVLAVADGWDSGESPGALLSKERAENELAKAREILSESAATVITRVVRGNRPWEVLLAESRDADLLVVARHANSRARGITHGSTATNLIHRARRPLLVALAPPKGTQFPGRIMVAADGPGHPEDAVRLAGQIAKHAGAAAITLLRLDWSRRAKRPALAEAVAQLQEATGTEPVEIVVGGTPRRLIPQWATREGASLIVMGTRELTGVRALRSVSERVAHEAPCSVLILHGHDRPEDVAAGERVPT